MIAGKVILTHPPDTHKVRGRSVGLNGSNAGRLGAYLLCVVVPQLLQLIARESCHGNTNILHALVALLGGYHHFLKNPGVGERHTCYKK